MNPRLAVLSVFFSIAGIVLAEESTIIGVVLCTAVVVVLILQMKYKVLLILFFLPFFFIYTNIYEASNVSSLSQKDSVFFGTINTIPNLDGDRLSFEFTVRNQESVNLHYRIRSAAEKRSLKNLQINMKCKLEGTLERPPSKTHFYGMDYKQYLESEKIFWILTPNSFHFTDCNSSADISFIQKLKGFRSKQISLIEQYFSPSTSGMMNALLFGYRKHVDPEILDSYQKLGLTHLLAVSGFNVGIVSFFLYRLAVRIGMIKELAYSIIILLLPVYIILTGGESSIVRAGIMGMVVMISLLFKRKIPPATLLSSVCIAMLLYNPAFTFDLGFQLSFLMTFVLITSISLYESKSYVEILLMTSFKCFLFSVPIILYHFFEVSIWSIPFNLIYIPLVSLVQFPLSFFAYIVIFVFPYGIPIIKYFLERVFNLSVQFLSITDGFNGTFTLGRPSAYIILLFYISLLNLLFHWERGGKFRFILVLPFLFVIIGQAINPYMDPHARVSFINVGQGDSILIELPYRRGVYLIDTGGSFQFEREEWALPRNEFDVTKESVSSYLKFRGIKKIDALILTHGDADHIKGATYLMNHFHVKTIMTSSKMNWNELEESILTEAKKLGIKHVMLKKGSSWGMKNASFTVLHPEHETKDRNNQSLVLWARFYDTTFLFPGDLEKEGEKMVVREFKSLHADVLKAGHHGSNTSTTLSFLEEIDPEYAIISVGKKNIYGHPNDEVITRLQKRNISILRTDQNGDISFVISSDDRKVNTVQ